MRIYITLLLAILSTGVSFSQSTSEAPKSKFVVNINGKEQVMSEGEEMTLDSTLIAPVISIKLADYRVFDNPFLAFNYPSHFAFEYEGDYGFRNWTLDGNNFVIMYFEIDAKTDLDDYVDEMVGQFGKKNCKVEKKQIKLGGQNLVGKRINVSLVGAKLTLDFLEIKSSDFKSRFIAFQDTKNDDGSDTDESKATLKMLDKTIKYK